MHWKDEARTEDSSLASEAAMAFTKEFAAKKDELARLAEEKFLREKRKFVVGVTKIEPHVEYVAPTTKEECSLSPIHRTSCRLTDCASFASSILVGIKYCTAQVRT
jgi:hypothetical protein